MNAAETVEPKCQTCRDTGKVIYGPFSPCPDCQPVKKDDPEAVEAVKEVLAAWDEEQNIFQNDEEILSHTEKLTEINERLVRSVEKLRSIYNLEKP